MFDLKVLFKREKFAKIVFFETIIIAVVSIMCVGHDTHLVQ